MKSNFGDYAKFRDLLEQHGALCLGGGRSWADGVRLPNASLDLPTITKKSRIQIVAMKRNPIFVQLADGTQLFFSYHEFRRLVQRPEVGRLALVKMTRLPDDSSGLPSKIQSFQILTNPST